MTFGTLLCSIRRALALGLLMAAAQLSLFAQKTPVINRITDIDLGLILAGSSAGTITLNPLDGSRSSSGGASLGTSAGVRRGSYTLTGKAGDTWVVRVISAFPISLAGPMGGRLTMRTVDFEPSNTKTGVFPAGGTTPMFYLGATLSVGTTASTPQGTYTGFFTLEVRDTSPGGKTSTQSFSVKVRVDPVITLTKTADLSFGDIFAGPTAGTVILSPAGSRSATGGLLLGNLSAAGAAVFTVHGAANATYAILLPASITMTGPAGTMLVSPFTSTPGPSGRLSASGTQQLRVGATLNVMVNQADGDYAGTFSVTTVYN